MIIREVLGAFASFHDAQIVLLKGAVRAVSVSKLEVHDEESRWTKVEACIGVDQTTAARGDVASTIRVVGSNWDMFCSRRDSVLCGQLGNQVGKSIVRLNASVRSVCAGVEQGVAKDVDGTILMNLFLEVYCMRDWRAEDQGGRRDESRVGELERA